MFDDQRQRAISCEPVGCDLPLFILSGLLGVNAAVTDSNFSTTFQVRQPPFDMKINIPAHLGQKNCRLAENFAIPLVEPNTMRLNIRLELWDIKYITELRKQNEFNRFQSHNCVNKTYANTARKIFHRLSAIKIWRVANWQILLFLSQQPNVVNIRKVEHSAVAQGSPCRRCLQTGSWHSFRFGILGERLQLQPKIFTFFLWFLFKAPAPNIPGLCSYSDCKRFIRLKKETVMIEFTQMQPQVLMGMSNFFSRLFTITGKYQRYFSYILFSSLRDPTSLETREFSLYRPWIRLVADVTTKHTR